MRSSLEDRLANLERNVAAFCNCRIATAYHNADCLLTILKFQDLPCPAHSFRFLGIFSRVPPTEAVLPNDREFCHCLPNTDLENYSWESDLERSKRDFGCQMRLMKRYVMSPGPKYSGDYPHAVVLSDAKVAAEAQNLNGFALTSSDDRKVYELGEARHRQRQEWIADNAQPLPRSIDIWRLNFRRFWGK